MTSAYEERHRRPVSLRGEQLAGEPVTMAREPIPVLAWIVWPNGTQEQIRGTATEWTARAVHVRWKAGHRIEHEAWVWAPAVQRLSRSGEPPTSEEQPPAPGNHRDWR